jgi:DNA-binding NarL/FixJ family response regulator
LSEPRIVIVDDHELFRAGVRSELEQLVAIAAEASTVDEAVAAIERERPEVVLLDVHMPEGGGVEVIRRAARTGTRFLALSVSDAAEDVIAVIRAGARGYVTKTISGPELADAIRRVHEGDAVFSPRLAGFVLDAFTGAHPSAPGARGPAVHRARLHVQGDRVAAGHLGEDGRGPRLGGAAQAAALEPARALTLGGRAQACGAVGPRRRMSAAAPASAPPRS